jgi:hypothetical protein
MQYKNYINYIILNFFYIELKMNLLILLVLVFYNKFIYSTYEYQTSIYISPDNSYNDQFFIKLYITDFDTKNLIENDLKTFNIIINYRYFPYTNDWTILNIYPKFALLKYNKNSNHINIYMLERINSIIYMYYDRFMILNSTKKNGM